MNHLRFVFYKTKTYISNLYYSYKIILLWWPRAYKVFSVALRMDHSASASWPPHHLSGRVSMSQLMTRARYMALTRHAWWVYLSRRCERLWLHLQCRVPPIRSKVAWPGATCATEVAVAQLLNRSSDNQTHEQDHESRESNWCLVDNIDARIDPVQV